VPRGQSPTPLKAVSLFSNCGAGDLGFARAGFSFAVMAELDERRLEVALLNHTSAVGIAGDLRETLPQVVKAYRTRAGQTPPALLAACPPCQGLSSVQSARGLSSDADAGSSDDRNLLVQVIISAVEELQPRAIVVENVPAFLKRKVRHPRTAAPVSAAGFLIEELQDDYRVYPMLADLADFGIPQSRKRSFLTFFRRSDDATSAFSTRGRAPYPWPWHAARKAGRVTLERALKSFSLPRLDAASPRKATSRFALHSVPVWDEARYSMVQAIPGDSGLSAWDNSQCTRCGRTTRDLQRLSCSRCGRQLPRPMVKDESGQFRLVMGFRTSYRRMDPKSPASTITTASGHLGSDRTIHPVQNRVLSPLECALLQTFPRSFKWGDALSKWGATNVRAMIGEAVPPLFTEKHGRILADALRGEQPPHALRDGDKRMTSAWDALGLAAPDATAATSK
jgi:DNA (cytosine-5)-methyltransferase 1